jgi:hypothetical protein
MARPCVKNAGVPRISQIPWSGSSRCRIAKSSISRCRSQENSVSSSPASRARASAHITSPTTSAWYCPAAPFPIRTGVDPS